MFLLFRWSKQEVPRCLLLLNMFGKFICNWTKNKPKNKNMLLQLNKIIVRRSTPLAAIARAVRESNFKYSCLYALCVLLHWLVMFSSPARNTPMRWLRSSACPLTRATHPTWSGLAMLCQSRAGHCLLENEDENKVILNNFSPKA